MVEKQGAVFEAEDFVQNPYRVGNARLLREGPAKAPRPGTALPSTL